MFNLLKRRPQRRRTGRRSNLTAAELLEVRLLKTDILPGQGDAGQTTAPTRSTSSESGDADQQSSQTSTPTTDVLSGGSSYDESSAISQIDQLFTPQFIFDPNELGEGSANYDPGLGRTYDNSPVTSKYTSINAIALERALDLMLPVETQTPSVVIETSSTLNGWDVPISFERSESEESR